MASKRLPVLVFLHGGGFFGGAANIYAGAGLSQAGPAVVVTLNYRLGSLGYFAHPELDRERASEPSGADGIRDQQQALRWVRDNIASFGGDPENVTLFGQSAGGSSTCIHLVSPGSRELVKRFIVESGVCTRSAGNPIAATTREDAYKLTTRLITELCPGATDVMACMRKLPAEKLQEWLPKPDHDRFVWRPVIEGVGGVLPESPDALISSGRINPGEVIVGSTKHEFALFTAFDAPTTVNDMKAAVQAEFGSRTDALMAKYAPSGTVDVSQAYVDLMSDGLFRCPTRSFARALSAQGAKVYLYSFEQGAAQHTDELVYVFGPDHYAGGFLGLLGGLPEALLKTIPRYWSNFAKTGDPNASDLRAWPLFEAASEQHLVFVDPLALSSGFLRETCDFWDGLQQ